MEEKIYFKDLQCYKLSSSEYKNHRLYSPNSSFDIAKIGDRITKSQLEAFIRDRGMKLTPLSIRSDLYPYNQLCRFINMELPEMQSFLDISQEKLIKKAKAWLLKENRRLFHARSRTSNGTKYNTEAELIKYIKKIYNFLCSEDKKFCFTKDIWYLKDIPMKIRYNPVKQVESISFQKIKQDIIREEIKHVIYCHLADMALGAYWRR